MKVLIAAAALLSCVQNVQGQLGSALEAGSFFLDAYKVFNEITEHNKAKAFISIENYSNKLISRVHLKQDHGLTVTDIPTMVYSGTKEAMTAKGEGAGFGTEMTLSFSMYNNMRIFVYFKIERAGIRDPNFLGVAITEDDGGFGEDVEVCSTEYAGMLQCATSDIVVQAVMSTDHESDVTVKVYPVSKGNLSRRVKRKVRKLGYTRNEWTNMYRVPQSCGAPPPSIIADFNLESTPCTSGEVITTTSSPLCVLMYFPLPMFSLIPALKPRMCAGNFEK